MKVLFDAIVVKVNELTESAHNAFWTDIGGRFYLDEPPQKVTHPYVVYGLISGNPDWTFDKDQEIFLIQFDLWSSAVSRIELEDMYTDLIALFDYKDTTLSVSGYTFIYLRRTSTIDDRIDDMWVKYVTYEMKIEKTD